MATDSRPDDAASADDRIDTARDDQVAQWAKKLDSTAQQIKEAVQAVGNRPADVEAHLKGVRSSTNTERVQHSGDKPRG
jgi:hypothetical protein